MAKRNRTAPTTKAAAAAAAEHEAAKLAMAGTEADDEEQAADEARANSVVRGAYKQKYRLRADEKETLPKGVSRKALRRTTGDWLGLELARLVLDEKSKLVVAKLEAVLDANGVAHAKWNRTTKGWQGRLRMSGRMALQTIVAREGKLIVPDAEAIPAPRAWVQAHTH